MHRHFLILYYLRLLKSVNSTNITTSKILPFISRGPGFTDGVTNTLYPSKSLLVLALANDSLSWNLYFLSASLSTIIKSSTSTKMFNINVLYAVDNKNRQEKTLKYFNSVRVFQPIRVDNWTPFGYCRQNFHCAPYLVCY